MDWQQKIKLVAMINNSNSTDDHTEIRTFIKEHLKDIDHQGLGIIVRALNLSPEHLQEDLDFSLKLKKKLKSVDIKGFSSIEKQRIQSLFENLNMLKYSY